jgi:hypothetical protein
MCPPDTPAETHTPKAAAYASVGHAFSFEASELRTAAPGHVESEIASLGRGGDIWIRTERELAVDTIPNEDEDHRAEEFRPGLPNTLSGRGCHTLASQRL